MKIFTDDTLNKTANENITWYEEEEETNYWSMPYHDALYIIVPITIIYMAIFLTGVVGNISTCIVIARNKHMHTATNYYLFSLAISDLLLLLSGLPPEVFGIWQKRTYMFGDVFCRLQSVAAETSANATVLTITAFTIERYVAICHPFQSHTLSKLSRAVKFVIAIWISALGLAVPQAIQYGVVTIKGPPGFGPAESYCTLATVLIPNAFFISICVFFVIPMTVITVLYVLIGLKLRKSKLITLKRPSFSKGDMSRHRTITSQRHVIRMLVAVVVGFFICWAPFHAQRLVALYGHLDEHPTKTVTFVYNCLTYISGVLYYLSTTINPLLYNIMSHKFRDAFKSTLVQLCREKKENKGEQRKLYLTLARSTNRLSYNNENSINMVSFHNIKIRRKKSIVNGNLDQEGGLAETQKNEENQLGTTVRASSVTDSSVFFQDDGLSPVRPKSKRIKIVQLIKEKNLKKNKCRGPSNSSQMTLTTSYSKMEDERPGSNSQVRRTNSGEVKFHVTREVMGYEEEGRAKGKESAENCTCWKCNKVTRTSTLSSKRPFKSKRSSQTLETIAKKFGFLTIKNKYSKGYANDCSAHSNTHSKGKLTKTFSSYTISNTSLQDLDKSEFTCCELATTMGQMKYSQEVQV